MILRWNYLNPFGTCGLDLWETTNPFPFSLCGFRKSGGHFSGCFPFLNLFELIKFSDGTGDFLRFILQKVYKDIIEINNWVYCLHQVIRLLLFLWFVDGWHKFTTSLIMGFPSTNSLSWWRKLFSTLMRRYQNETNK